jgi:hypothetical protein
MVVSFSCTHHAKTLRTKYVQAVQVVFGLYIPCQNWDVPKLGCGNGIQPYNAGNLWVAHTVLHWPLPAVRDLTRDVRWSVLTGVKRPGALCICLFSGWYLPRQSWVGGQS